MTNGSSSKIRHLSVVSHSSDKLGSDLRSVESLNDAESLQLQHYITNSKISGTVVGALLGTEGWDVRPVVLRSGALSLFRFTNPAWVLERTKLDHFKVQCKKLSSFDSGFLACGETNGQVWIERSYFDGLMDGTSSSEHTFYSLHPVQQAQSLVRLIDQMHAIGVVHGHIVPANIAVKAEKIFLVDHFFGALSLAAARSDLAPEISVGLGAAAHSDIYGLGMVLRTILAGHVGVEHTTFIQKMLAAEASLRPNLDQVKQIFAISNGAQNAAQRSREIVTNGTQPAVPRGKVISNVAVSAAPAVAALKVEPIQYGVPNELIRNGNNSPIVAAPKNKKAISSVALPLIFLACLGAGLAYKLDLIPIQNPDTQVGVIEAKPQPIDSSKFEALWQSGQPSLMRDVIKAALTNEDKVAESIIIKEALTSANSQVVRTKLLKIAFNPLWEGTLTDSDRKVALALGAAKIYPEGVNGLPALETLHPAVLLGLLSEMEPQSGSKELAAIPPSRLALLGEPFSSAFTNIEKLGVKSVDDVSVQALAHILTADLSEEVLKSYFLEQPREKLIIIFSILNSTKNTAAFEKIWKLFSQHNQIKSELAWFDAEKSAEWSKVNQRAKLALLVGLPLLEELNQVQLVDLLMFPNEPIRLAASQAIAKKIGKDNLSTLKFIISNKNALERDRTLVLVTTLMLQRSDAEPLLVNWFAKEPNAQSVAELLIARKNLSDTDLLNELCADYLLKAGFKPSLQQFEALASHPVPLARTLAYVNLKVAEPKQRAILESMVKIEPDAKIRELIQQKLTAAKDLESIGAKP